MMTFDYLNPPMRENVTEDLQDALVGSVSLGWFPDRYQIAGVGDLLHALFSGPGGDFESDKHFDFDYIMCYILTRLLVKSKSNKSFRGSSVVERSPVKRLVVGSNPTRGANDAILYGTFGHVRLNVNVEIIALFNTYI